MLLHRLPVIQRSGTYKAKRIGLCKGETGVNAPESKLPFVKTAWGRKDGGTIWAPKKPRRLKGSIEKDQTKETGNW